MKDLSRRMIASGIAIAIVVCLVLFAFHPLFQFVVAGAVAAIAGVAVWEYAQLALAKGCKVVLPILITLTLLLVLSFFIAQLPRYARYDGLPLILFFVSLFTLFALHFRSKEGAIVDLAVSSFGLLYIAIPLGMLLGILYLDIEDGRWWVAYLLVVTKITDMGGYFGGSLWGKRKLAPMISPSKSVEGAICGLLCAMGASFVFHRLSKYSEPNQFNLDNMEWICLGLLLGLLGQFGDLAESLLKRDANKKDSNALPGLGGVLDSVDSLLFNIPILYLYLYLIKV